MKNIVLVLSFAIASAACSQTSPTASDTVFASAAVDGVPYEQLVGRWQFVYDDARRTAVEAQLSAKISDPAALAEAKREASEEASNSTIEFTKDRLYVSRIGDKELLRGPIDKAPPGVTLTLRDDRTLVMHDPQKGDLVFSRR